MSEQTVLRSKAGRAGERRFRDLAEPVFSRVVRPRHAWYVPLKHVAEYAGALALSVLAIPIIVAAAGVIKISSRGPVFYRQFRVGRQGRPFRIIKLRTMIHEAEAACGPVWSSGSADPRVTPFGRMLRNTHIDEFPQLANVLAGQMSLIGPRPERPEFVRNFESSIPEYSQRLSVRPGITGYAQIVLPPDTDDAGIDGVRAKVQYDLCYILNMNPWLDIKIAISTAGLLLSVLWHYICRAFSLPACSDVNQTLFEVANENRTDSERGILGRPSSSWEPH